MKCPACDALKGADHFCSECGTPFDPQVHQVVREYEEIPPAPETVTDALLRERAEIIRKLEDKVVALEEEVAAGKAAIAVLERWVENSRSQEEFPVSGAEESREAAGYPECCTGR